MSVSCTSVEGLVNGQGVLHCVQMKRDVQGGEGGISAMPKVLRPVLWAETTGSVHGLDLRCRSMFGTLWGAKHSRPGTLELRVNEMGFYSQSMPPGTSRENPKREEAEKKR